MPSNHDGLGGEPNVSEHRETNPAASIPTLSTHTPEQIERYWLEHVYRGDRVAQLTVRAVVMGAVLGVVTGLSNLYVGLKAGWSLGVVITASIMCWAIWSTFVRVRLARTPMTILETNAMASTASAAGYSTGTVMTSAVSAYLMVVGEHLPFWQLTLWVLTVGVLGVFMAIPMKRQFVNVEQLPFPTGTAAAETLRGLFAEGEEGRRRARALFLALGVGVLVKWMTSGTSALAAATDSAWLGSLAVPELLPTPAMQEAVPFLASAFAYTWALEVSTLLVAAGVIVGWRVCWSLMLGSVLCFGVLAPWMHDLGAIESLGYGGIVQWSLWGGVSLMVVSGLLMFFLQWRTVLRAFSGLRDLLGKRRRSADADPMARVEVPASWFVAGVTVAGLALVVLEAAVFDIPVPLGVVAVALAFVLAIVAARATGETDITPVGALGKIAQLGYGGLMRGQMVPNLMAAGVTAGVASSSADLLTDLRSGYLLGASPRKQFWAQFAGVWVGALVVVAAFMYVLIPDPGMLGTAQWPAPAGRVWRSVAELLSVGFEALHPSAVYAIWIGAAAGVVLVALDRRCPRLRPYVPSATGLGLAFVLPAFNALSFCMGGGIALYLARRRPAFHARYTVAIAAGLIAGESLTGIVAALILAQS